jgi:hypothetical protein
MTILALFPRQAAAQTHACQIRWDLSVLPKDLDYATAVYLGRHSRPPASAQDLIDDGELRRLPVDPKGMPYSMTLRADGSWIVGLSDGRYAPSAWDCFLSERSLSELPGAAVLIGAVAVGALGSRSKVRKRKVGLLVLAATLFAAGLVLWDRFGIIY